ncbi:hypothetical protein CASFOL_033661 [Castilleja foliolosa]|uniref:Peptidase A1 domain-containing protein n=1 Tax=Castilleja foliolosa TaxID=1961234 RepID=A0ABD3BXJ7_9LAMI
MDRTTRARRDEPNRILLITIHHMLYPIIEEVLHQVFSPYGSVEKIVTSEKSTGFQALIQYESHLNAISARNFLQGHYIYDGCCQLDIEFSNFDAHDITSPTARVEYKTENHHDAHIDTLHMKDAIVDVSDADDLMPQTNQVEVLDMVEDIELVELVELEECDSSIPVDDITSLEVEKGVAANINSVETVDLRNKVVEKEYCKGVVPCAQIFDLAASDFGERDWSVKLGNLDFIFFLGVRDQSEKRRKRDARTASLTYFLSYTLRTRWFFKRGRMLWLRAGQRGRGPKSGRWAETPRCKQQLGDYSDNSKCSYNPHSSCLYTASYGDGSHTTGNISTETLTFGKARVENVTIGCGHDNQGKMEGYAGLLGLGRGDLSFPRQIGSNKFSYCLASLLSTTYVDPPSNLSSITFGDSQIKANFTPLLQNPVPQLNSFYYVGLKGISVGGKLVQGIDSSYFEMGSDGRGGVIVDSGTTVSYLNQKAYIPLREAFTNSTNLTVITTDYTEFDTCYSFSGLKEITVPSVVLHLDGVDMDLPWDNYLLNMDGLGTFCFGFVEQEGGVSIIGNMQQQGFQVSYDWDNNLIGFTPNACPPMPSG